MPIYRRVPKRGFTNARFRTDYTTINVDKLNGFEDGAVVDLDSVLAAGLVSKNSDLLKVLGNGTLERRLTVRAQKCSRAAAEKIRAAGGEIIYRDAKGRVEGEATPGASETVDGADRTQAAGEAPATDASGAGDSEVTGEAGGEDA